MKLTLFILLASLAATQGIEENQVVEWTIRSDKQYADPFNDVEVTLVATTTYATNIRRVSIPAFWAGGNVWKARFSSPRPGSFWISVISSDPSNESFKNWKTNVAVTSAT